MAAWARLPAGTRLRLAALQVVPQGRRQPVRLIGFGLGLGRGARRPAPARCLWRFGLAGRHHGSLKRLCVGLNDAAFQVNRSHPVVQQWRGSEPGATRGAGIHQAMESADILAMAPPALEVLPPTPHRDHHDHLRRIGSPRSRRAGYRSAMIERWPNCGKLMKATEKSGFFRALPWLAQSGIVRAVFGGRPPASPDRALP